MEIKKNWIKEALAGHKPGTLHKQLGVPAAKNIPMSKLKEAAKAGGKLGKRANLALTLRKITNKKYEEGGKMEYLKGGQVKLDVNKDNKITGEDFKMMKKK